MDDAKKEFLGKGWAFPVSLDPYKGSVTTAAFDDDVKQAIRIILGTSPGERVMHPNFGCGIYDLAFEIIDSATLVRIKNLVEDALTRYEPRIELIDEVQVDPYRAEEGILDVHVVYRIRRTNQTGNLVYPFYFREGGQP